MQAFWLLSNTSEWVSLHTWSIHVCIKVAKHTVDQQRQAQNYAVCDTTSFLSSSFLLVKNSSAASLCFCALMYRAIFFDILFESWQNNKTFLQHMHILTEFGAYRRNLVKPLHKFRENVRLQEPALEECKNVTACRSKASQMREHICTLLAILHTKDYTRSCGCCLMTNSHKNAKETMNKCNSSEVCLPP